jgi:hypothetical protein
MNGKTPTASECSSLCQVVYEVLKHVIPPELIQSDKGRILEGSRLFFGFVLDRALRYKDADDKSVPLLSSLSTLDLRNFETLEPVSIPSMTSIGLVDEGYFNAYREGGILSWTNGRQPLRAEELDPRVRRIVLLSGGMASEVTAFDTDSLSSDWNEEFTECGEEITGARGMSDLRYLAAMSEQSRFAVLRPSSLRLSNPPALSLDRDCLLTVYVGRPKSAEAGKE